MITAAAAAAAAAAATAAANPAGADVAASSMAFKPPRVLVVSELRNLDVGLWEGQSTKLVRGSGDSQHRACPLPAWGTTCALCVARAAIVVAFVPSAAPDDSPSVRSKAGGGWCPTSLGVEGRA
jgi:hypothetical protein